MLAYTAGGDMSSLVGGSSLATWSLAVWLRTSVASGPVVLLSSIGSDGSGYVVGVHMGHGGSALEDGDAATGRIGIRARDTGGWVSLGSCPAAVTDGALHHVCVVSDGVLPPAIYVDGSPASMVTGRHDLSWHGGIAPDEWYLLGSWSGVPFATAAVDVGEYAVFDRPLSAGEIAALAGGWSPLCLATWPVRYLAGSESDPHDYVSGAEWGYVPPTSAAGHVAVISPDQVLRRAAPDWRPGRYEVYYTPGRRAVPGTDTPAAVLPAGASGAALHGLAHVPSVVHSVEVYAVSAAGRATSSPVVEIPVDSGGRPDLVPAAVRAVRATALAAGEVRVRWEYVEPSVLATAATFAVIATPVGISGATPSETAVQHVPPQQSYAVTIGPLQSGLWMIEVQSRSVSGAALTGAAVARVIADAAAPVEEVGELEVV